MNMIKILPPEEVQKISAGEVVERPSNIVKETIENSIDAGATQISLYIEDAGQGLIRIVDDGSGMNVDDAKLSFYPHATSKLNKVEDLEQIGSFGFRGEALASISSVSKVVLITKIKEEELGFKLELDAGKVISEGSVACSVGTDLQIRDLFFNVPVRKKFLKRGETEWNQIQSTFYSFCINNSSIHFKLYRDQKLVLNAPGVDNVKTRASQIWGHNFAENLIPIEEVVDTKFSFAKFVKISGFITNHLFSRYGRQQIFFFANNRWIKNQSLSKALLKGYLNVLPPAKFPAAFIFLDLNREFVDVNIHPRKEEVRFTKPKTIENGLKQVVQQTLANNLSKSLNPVEDFQSNVSFDQNSEVANLSDVSLNDVKYEIPNSKGVILDSDRGSQSLTLNVSSEFSNRQPLSTVNFLPDSFSEKSVSFGSENILEALFNKKVTPVRHDLPSKEEINQGVSRIVKTEFVNRKIIGQLFDTYILIDNQNEFVIIDQHAAHERVLYEKYLIKFEKKEGTRLLFPEIVQLTSDTLQLVLKEKEFLYNQGIEIEQFGPDQIAIKTSPPKLQNQSLKDFIFQMVQFIEENEGLDTEEFRKKLNEHVHSHLACKMAIKAGDKLTHDQMKKLIEDLDTTEKKFICVHGRPTTWIIPKLEVEKKFRRK